MIYSIENENLYVAVDTLGAQLASVRSKKTGVEYLWQGHPDYWNGRAYNLFPFIGRMFGGEYVYQGNTYKIRPHGLARYYEFALTEQTENTLGFTFTHESADGILEQYPFHFAFTVRFLLSGDTLTTEYSVKNLETERTLIAAFGGHPGINVPFDGGCFEDYYVQFEGADGIRQHLLSENMFMDGATVPYSLVDGDKLPLRHPLFDNDALIFSGSGKAARLCKKGSSRYVRMEYPDYKYFALWHAVKTDAPYVCFEPWQALCATEGVVDDIETKPDMLHIKAGESAKAIFTLQIVE